MSVSSTDYIKRYTGDAGTVAYSFPYYASASSDISVDIDDVVQSSGFTTTGSGSSWTVTFVTPPAVGETVVLYRETTNTQASDYVTNDAIPDDVIEADFDKRTAVSQEIDGERARSIKLPRSDVPDSDNSVLPNASDRSSKAFAFDSSGNIDMVTVNNVSASNAAGITYTPEGTGAVDTTVQAKIREFVSSRDWLGVSDGSTDDTAAILTAASKTTNGVVLIPPNTFFDKATLMATLPTDVVCLNFSAMESFDSAGETTKSVGIISSDEAVNDTHWTIDSDHHPILALNNFGGAGSSSATSRRASVMWQSGELEGTGATKDGWRGCAMNQFAKETGEDFWVWQLRSLAPWLSIAGDYERWETGLSVTTGDYMVHLQHYVAASTGTTGATPPTHLTGTVSDGGVDWTFVDYADRTCFTIDELGRLKLNGGVNETDIFGARPASVDSVGTANYTFGGRADSQNAAVKLVPKDSGGTDSPQPFLLAQDGVGTRVRTSDNTDDVCRFEDDGLVTNGFAMLDTTAADADTTPSVANVGTLYLSNTGATSITDLDGEKDNQIVRLVATNGNTTLVHSSSFSLSGASNVTMGTFDAVTMQKVPTGVSDKWVEVSRSSGGGSGDLLAANNLSDVASATTSATNLGVGTGDSPTFVGQTLSGLTASEIVATDGSKALQSLAVATYPSLAELAYVKGVTSAIQTQIDAAGGGAFTADGDTEITPTTAISLVDVANDEIALDLSYTVNKASGTNNDTGLRISTKPIRRQLGVSLLMDLQTGGA